jgi:hypothetical protein
MDMWLTHMLNDRLIVWVSDQQINWLSKPFTVLIFLHRLNGRNYVNLQRFRSCEISGPRGGEYEDGSLLGYSVGVDRLTNKHSNVKYNKILIFSVPARDEDPNLGPRVW